MYTERFSLPFLAGVLIAAAERQRPGLGVWTPEVRSQLLQTFREELEKAKPAFLELFNDPAGWAGIEKALLEVCFPRYAVLAEKQTSLELREYGLWRGGDLLARSAFFGIGIGLGLFLVKAPFIPIPQTWDFLILALGLGGPFVPDIQVWFAQRRYGAALHRVIEDMGEAQQTQQLYAPLHAEAIPDPVVPVASPEPVSEERPSASDRVGDKT